MTARRMRKEVAPAPSSRPRSAAEAPRGREFPRRKTRKKESSASAARGRLDEKEIERSRCRTPVAACPPSRSPAWGGGTPPGRDGHGQILCGCWARPSAAASTKPPRRSRSPTAYKVLVDEESDKACSLDQEKSRDKRRLSRFGRTDRVSPREIDKICAARTLGAEVKPAGRAARPCCRSARGTTVRPKTAWAREGPTTLRLSPPALPSAKPSDLLPELQGRPADPGRAQARSPARTAPDLTGEARLVSPRRALIQTRASTHRF